MRLGRDGIAGLIGLAFSLALLPYAFGLPKLPIVPVGPGFYPKLVLTFMAVTCALLVLQDIFTQRRLAAAPQEAAEPAPRRAYDLVGAGFVLMAAYVGLLPLLGFRIATALFVAAFQIALERPRTLRQWAVMAAIAVGSSALSYVVFERYLSVLLPRGIWTGW